MEIRSHRTEQQEKLQVKLIREQSGPELGSTAWLDSLVLSHKYSFTTVPELGEHITSGPSGARASERAPHSL